MNERNLNSNPFENFNGNNNPTASNPPLKGKGQGERLLKYEDALAKLEDIARKMESGQYDIDELTTQLKKAQELIKLCKDKLTKTDEEIRKILDSTDRK